MEESPLEAPTAWGKLSGTLAWPAGAQRCTVALLIAGSGPTDRDGNNPLAGEPVDSLRQLARALAALGIASLRYDKRGIGESSYPGLEEEALRFDHMVEDAVLLARRLAQEPRADRVVLVGHSEGALIAALAAADAGAAAVVSLAGAGVRASTLMRVQIESSLPREIAAPALAALAALEAQQPVVDVSDTLALLFRHSVQPYLMSWFRHDPAVVVAALAEPVLLVHGAADTQVTVDHARWLRDASPRARLRIVEDMDHLLAVRGDVALGAAAVAGEVAGWLQELDARVPA
ncbi:alpha/beta hydrolase family protein [Ramlibacter sp.]|uniref:alpha/beta hydrolase family protein n=1 Tax=Ramlibacter sp. TaxID=1917967 RepID=UPI002FCA0F4E